MKLLKRIFSSNRPPLVHVSWSSRSAPFDNSDTESIIRKACRHFRLGRVEHEYVLVTSTSDGGRIEVTDDLLKRLPDGSLVELVRISAFESFGSEREGRFVEKPLPSPTYPKRDGTPSTAKSSTRYNPSPQSVRPPVSQPSHHSRPSQSHSRPRPSPFPRASSPIPLSPESEDSIPSSPYAPTDFPSRSRTPSDNTPYVGPRYRKPVIYLFPPETVPDATVSVHLVPQWTFTHIYPLADTKLLADGRQTITWSVSASPDGTLVEKGTGLELSYIFWEAAVERAAPPSPPLSAADAPSIEHFDPAHPSLSPDTPTVVLLPFQQLLPYLDGVLKELMLHTAARNDFITYWLPLLSKEPYVALRFVPQPAYERAAELVIQPAPDVITRVMMLFRGVPAIEADMWSAARDRVGEVRWATVIGVKPEATDESLFRVLEWGAIEVS
ncbi:hypothetical protein BD311DRAFT_712541 [Dichomitus squalens]|uniref:Uncharacterized protein n=1 Tax=Dichomitus squalens TaxID=114155 RepID=A0A4V2K1N5_9APHY|nr:hypothetical protein BD311DRAFT_712541 [Dichomitus squalens]